MSDSDSDNFALSGDDDASGSDFGASSSKGKKSPAAKKAAPAKKAPVKKAAAAKVRHPSDFIVECLPSSASIKKAAPAKKPAKAPLASKKHSNDSLSDNGSDIDESPPKKKPKGNKVSDDEDFGGSSSKAPANAKNASEIYQKLSQRDHVLKRPDTYIGSVEAITQPMWVLEPASKTMVHRNITFVPGFLKIFDEILVNAADNKINDPSMDTIKVEIDREKNIISVYNNGRGIPVEMHTKENVMIPELIFGHLLAGSNFDDDQKKLTGGRNGYGAKLTNIYSHEFIVETADKSNSKKYKQIFTNNMGTKKPPKIAENKKDEEWTKITFKPDLERFNMANIDDDTTALLMKRVYDMAGTIKDLKVTLNGERVKVKNFKQYVEMYLNASTNAASDAAGGAAISKPPLIYEVAHKRWEVAFALSEGEFKQVSFVNSIATTKGGTHVDMIATQLANKLMDQIKKKNTAAPVKPFQIKNHMWIFVNAAVENPAFDSQTKENLTLKSSAFGSRCELSEDFVKKVAKTGIIDNVLNWAKFKQDQIMKKTDGSKRSRISGIVKLEDANNAGGKNSKLCTLILTEGDSAKALAVSGLAVVGRDHYGVFPLRGKLLNVREAGHDQIVKNTEIQHIRQILGLKHNQEYKSVDSLRYGHLMIMTDQDHDGSHIKGLIINFLDHFYPSLLRIPEFLVEFITPIVKVWKGKQEISFYTMPQYEEWKEENNDGRGWDSKYYKGLGTSTDADARKYFSALDKHRLPFEAMEPNDRLLIDMAFNKKKADDRKEWLRQFKPGTYLDHAVKSLPISDFVNRELILFSMADNIRSIPSVADGLKPGQRKVLFGCFKRNLVKEIKVAQLAGYVSEKTAYHHGEQSLTSTIVGLAQNYVGSNNVNLLAPNGQFGTRLSGGKDSASARYIFTNLPRMTRAVFHPADDGLLNYLVEDGMGIEPDYFLPTVPMVLINGADGIGTGWSTAIPNYNPVDIVNNIRRLMKNEELENMTPWFRGYKGTIERVDQDKYKVSGTVEKIDDITLEITELPIRKWTQDFKEMLEEMTVGSEKVPKSVQDYEEHHTVNTVHFKIHMTEKNLAEAEKEGLDKRFKLTTTLSTGNMVCFDLNGKIKKYSSPEQILEEFYFKRLEFYGLRKQYLADELTKQLDKLANQARFISMVVEDKFVVSKKRKAQLVAELREENFKPFPKKDKVKGADDPVGQDDEDEQEGLASDYDYLLGMKLWSLSEEDIEKLNRQRDLKEHELHELLKLTPQDIWNVDLDNFMGEWEIALQEDIAAVKSGKPKNKVAIAAALKRKMKATGDDSDSEEDFKPTKKVTKPRAAPKPKAASAKPTIVKAGTPLRDIDEESEAEVLPKPKAKPKAAAKPALKQTTLSKLVDGDDGSDADVIPPPKANTKPAANKTKAAAVDESADSIVEPDSPKPKSKPAAKKLKPAVKKILLSDDEATPAPKARVKPTAKKSVIAESDDDDDFDMSSPVKPKPKAKTVAKKAAAPKTKGKKKLIDSDEEDPFVADSDAEDAPPAPKTTARPGRGAAKKPAYIDMVSDDDE
ncbi:DNA topoisomerase II [Cryptococcus wingfieldii CBS 7118]|uniref:DNA topoisomerase 2 n=1 Tax=Cryptococcus wingfieldii CBS 7118 TaxID=1295528 RepID=A0A1E3IZX6_9TREE|nr:DNA topoisomerase II [Cryptococcus wingfieldii CBS 7118]ODN94177.1 DNA topoisomerase II [Cryptococcus wingfieldii CBS 7118]